MTALAVLLSAPRGVRAVWSATSRDPRLGKGYWSGAAETRNRVFRFPDPSLGGGVGNGSASMRAQARRWLAVVDVAAGEDHTCVVVAPAANSPSRRRAVRCWGSGFYGQLGTGSDDNLGDSLRESGGGAFPDVPLGKGVEPVAVATGAAHSCALTTRGRVKCWGWGVCGQTGYGHARTLGAAPGEMGAQLPFVDFGAGRHALSLALGHTHTCAVLSDATVRCWGCNSHGQLGRDAPRPEGQEAPLPSAARPIPLPPSEPPVEATAGAAYTCVRTRRGAVYCSGAMAFGARPRRVDLGGVAATALIGGRHFACAALSDGGLRCWGHPYSGEFAAPAAPDPSDLSAPLSSSPIDVGTSRVRLAAAGHFHICAATGNVSQACWGWNKFGQLGRYTAAFEPHAERVAPGPGIPGFLPGSRVQAIAAGAAHTCAITRSGLAVRCFGMGIAGQRGDGLRELRGPGGRPYSKASLLRFPREPCPDGVGAKCTHKWSEADEAPQVEQWANATTAVAPARNATENLAPRPPLSKEHWARLAVSGATKPLSWASTSD